MSFGDTAAGVNRNAFRAALFGPIPTGLLRLPLPMAIQETCALKRQAAIARLISEQQAALRQAREAAIAAEASERTRDAGRGEMDRKAEGSP